MTVLELIKELLDCKNLNAELTIYIEGSVNTDAGYSAKIVGILGETNDLVIEVNVG